jgi:hypothetical protein
MIRDEGHKKSRRALPKNLICPLSYRNSRMIDSGDLLSRLLLHIVSRDGADCDGSASYERQNLDWFGVSAAVTRKDFT